MIDNFAKIFKNKKVAILGFGKEGQSSFRFLKTLMPLENITIADKNENIKDILSAIEKRSLTVHTGPQHLQNIKDVDIVVKSPGIPKDSLTNYIPVEKITSQADLFIRFFSQQIIGVTGTKGKSTTSSLLQYIFENAGRNSFLVGNIGKPPFDYINNIKEETQIIYELSSHQLDDVHYSPHISIVLNLYEEHLDHYGSFEKYKDAKFNISKFQNSNDWLIVNGDDSKLELDYKETESKKLIFSKAQHQNQGAYIGSSEKVTAMFKQQTMLFDFSKRLSLPGEHNVMNIMAALIASRIMGVDYDAISKAVNGFKGLEHRLEYVGKFNEIDFYNDSIATIPEATIEAVKTLKKVNTLILGGKDRGIDYDGLITFLPNSGVQNIICLGDAGKRIYNGLKVKNEFCGKLFAINKFEQIEEIVRKYTEREMICLLSPAASSYDMFSNFEERGQAFKKIAGNF